MLRKTCKTLLSTPKDSSVQNGVSVESLRALRSCQFASRRKLIFQAAHPILLFATGRSLCSAASGSRRDPPALYVASPSLVQEF